MMIMKKEKLNKYFYILLTQILLSFSLMFCCFKIRNISDCILNNNISLLKIPAYFSKLLPSEKELNDETVYDQFTYDLVIVEDNMNKIVNYSFEGVETLVDGIIIKINRNNDKSYNVTIQDVEGYLYEYRNLKSIDFGIYTFIKSQTILGRSNYDSLYNGYCFDLLISKKGVYYDFYELSKG